MCLSVAAVLVLVGAILFLWACYQWLSVLVGPIMAKALVGLLAMAVAGGFAWIALRKNR